MPDPQTRRRKPRRRQPRVLVRREVAATLCSMGLSTFDRVDAGGLVPEAQWVGGCKLWSVAELKAWAARGCPPRDQWKPVWETLLASRPRNN